ncbi:MAG: hypothetical protein AAFQ87_15730 [Bacteroidota bacterium]
MSNQKNNIPSSRNRLWRKTAPLGLMMVGMGFSFTGEAIIWKMQDAPIWQWVAMGTVGLVIFNAGLSVFGDAVKKRTHEEWQQAQQNQKTNA